MAILEVKLHEESFDTKVGVILNRWVSYGTGKKVFRVASDAPITCDQATVASAGGVSVSQPGDTFSDDRPYAFLQSTKATHINGSPRHCEVECVFEDPMGGLALDDFINTPAKITSSGLNDTEEYWEDFSTDEHTGTPTPKPVVNTAFDVFDKPPTRLSSGRIYTIVKNLNASGKAAIQAILHSNNGESITIDGFTCDVDTLLLTDATFEPLSPGADVYKTTITIIYNPNIWFDKVPNVGFRELYYDTPTGDPLKRAIMEWDPKNHQWIPPASPFPLFPDGEAKDDPTDIDFLKFYPYPQRSWAAVPLS